MTSNGLGWPAPPGNAVPRRFVGRDAINKLLTANS
jgi:hypothetical protein